MIVVRASDKWSTQDVSNFMWQKMLLGAALPLQQQQQQQNHVNNNNNINNNNNNNNTAASKGATDFSIAAIMARGSSSREPSERSLSEFLVEPRGEPIYWFYIPMGGCEKYIEHLSVEHIWTDIFATSLAMIFADGESHCKF